MKKIISVILILCFVILLSGCSANSEKTNETQTKETVKINLPKDDTVNGYREKDAEKDYNESSMPNQINKNETNVISEISSNDPTSSSYCANKNSKVFHSISCGSVTDMKEKNKLYSSDRNALISQGYHPCDRCKP